MSEATPPAEGGGSQFGLLRTRRLGPLFVTQFFGAFNDNVLKQALALMFVFGGLISQGANAGIYVNLAAGLLILPFFLFSATAGSLADKVEKSRLIRIVKLGEIAVASLAGLALYLQNVPALLAVLFLLGTQSAFFGPLKYAILPQHLSTAELVGGNAIVQMGTFAAILLGTIIGGVIGARSGLSPVLFVMVVAVAVAGYLACRGIPQAASTHAGPVGWNPVAETWALIRLARERRAVFQSILGVSWFWLLGSVNLAQMAALVPEHLAGGASVVTLILILFTVAIAVGALLCERMSGRRVEIGLVPLGALGVSVFGIDGYFAITGIEGEGLRSAWGFLAGDGTPRLLIDLALMGLFAGMFVVPLQANIQVRTPVDRRARVIAANNVLNALFMVIGAGLAIAWLGFGGSVPGLLLALAVINIGVAAYIFTEVPEFAMRFLVWLISHTIYRVRHVGLANIPDRGPAVIVCNHVSYVDAPLLAGAVRRPIRFVMHESIYRLPVLNFIFRVGGAIPIAGRSEDAEIHRRAFESVRDALAAGDLVCIFPEGRLTTDGTVDAFRRGIERILTETPVPVVPMALRGLWGSFFSREGLGAFRWRSRERGLPGRFWSRVDVVATTPGEPVAVTAEGLRERVLALRGDRR